jgi:peptide/nickel transport system substrate-binding protein
VSLKNDPALEVVADLTPLQEEINFVESFPPFNNKLFREALTYAIPYSAILKNVIFGYGQIYYGPVNPVYPGFDAKDSAPRPFDLAKAKALIAQSGVKLPVNTTIVVAQGDAIEEQIATIAQGEWKQLGVNLNVETLSPAAFAAGIFSFKYPVNIRLGGPAVVDFGYYTSYDDTCGDAFNVTLTCLPANDALLLKARATSNLASRYALYAQYTRAWDADSPKIPVYASEQVVVLKKGTTGYVYDQNEDYRRLSAS